MSLDLGSLYGEIRIDDTKVEPGLRGIWTQVEQTMAKVEDQASASGKKAGGELTDAIAKATEGMPQEIAAQLEKLPRTMNGTISRASKEWNQLPIDAKLAGIKVNQYLETEMRQTARTVGAQAGRAGDEAGRQYTAGVKAKGGNAGHKLGRDTNRGMVAGADGEGAGGNVTAMFGKGLSKGKAGAVGAALAIGAAVSKAIGDSSSNEAQSDRAGASLGLTSEQADRLGRIAGKVYVSGMGESMADATDATAAVMSSFRGMRTASAREVEEMTKKVGTLADVFGLDIPRVAQVAGQAVKSGLVDNADRSLDLLSRSLQKVPANVRDDLLDAVDEYGPFLKSLGLGGAQAFGLLAKGADAGMYGIDKAGDALKEFTIRSTDMSTASKVGYELLGLDQEKMSRRLLKGGDTAEKAYGKIIDGLLAIKDPVKQSQAALALFGTPLEDLSVQEIPKFLGSLETTKTKLDDVRGASKRTGDVAYDSFGERLKQVRRQVELASDKLGDWLIPKLEKMGGYMRRELGPAWRDLGDTVRENRPLWEGLGRTLGDIAALGFGGTVWAIQTTIDAIRIGVEVFREVSEAALLMSEYTIRAFSWVADAAFTAFDKILTSAEKGLGWIPGLGDKIRGARKGFDAFRETTKNTLDDTARDVRKVRKNIERDFNINVGADTRNAKQQIRDLRRYAKRRIKAEVGIDDYVRRGGDPEMARGGAIPALAAGGVVERPTIALVGEAGPEVVRPKALDDEMRKGKGIDYDRLAASIGRAVGYGRPPLAQHLTVMPHDYADFERQMRDRAGDRAQGGAGIVPVGGAR